MGKWLKSTSMLTYSVQDHVARITLNRPEKRNALTETMERELREALLESDDRTDVCCVVLAGAGKDFCAGADMAEAYRSAGGGATAELGAYRAHGDSIDSDTWWLSQRLLSVMMLFDMHKPVIARIQGNCLGVGTDIALMCDILIAANDARIGFPPVRMQGSPMSHMWLYHLGPQWAKRLLLTGDSLRGKDAAKLGLVLKSVPLAKLDGEVNDLARRMGSIDAELLSCNKRIVNMGLEQMGARTLQRLAAENDARGHRSRARPAWDAMLGTYGVKAAIKMRDEPFGDGFAYPDDDR